MHQRIDEHKSLYSCLRARMVEHGDDTKNIEKNFKVLRKCRGTFKCLLCVVLKAAVTVYA